MVGAVRAGQAPPAGGVVQGGCTAFGVGAAGVSEVLPRRDGRQPGDPAVATLKTFFIIGLIAMAVFIIVCLVARRPRRG